MDSSVRSFLKAKAQNLKPIVMVGKGGVDPRIVTALDEALTSHELVKVKFQAFKDEKKTLAEQLAVETKSELIGIMGFIATFYRDSENHLMHFPKEMMRKGE